MKNEEKEKIKSLLSVVDDTIQDTKYVLSEDFKPYSGILKVLSLWLSSYILVSILFFVVNELNNAFALYNNQWYYPMIRISNIVLFIILPIFYYRLVNKKVSTIKEKNLLISFIPIIITFSLWRMLFTLSYYLNTDITLNLYSTLPLDLCINIIGLFILYRYFKEKSLLVMIFINVIYMIGSTIWLSHYMLLTEASNFEIQIFSLLSIIQENGIIIILSIGISLLLLKRKSGAHEYIRN